GDPKHFAESGIEAVDDHFGDGTPLAKEVLTELGIEPAAIEEWIARRRQSVTEDVREAAGWAGRVWRSSIFEDGYSRRYGRRITDVVPVRSSDPCGQHAIPRRLHGARHSLAKNTHRHRYS